MTMARTIKLYKLPEATSTPGLVPFDAPQHAAQVTVLLNDYLQPFKVAPVFTEHDVRHWWVGGGACVCVCVCLVGGLKVGPCSLSSMSGTGG